MFQKRNLTEENKMPCKHGKSKGKSTSGKQYEGG